MNILLPTKPQVERNIFICSARVTAAKRCFPGDFAIAILEIQKRRNILWLEHLSK